MVKKVLVFIFCSSLNFLSYAQNKSTLNAGLDQTICAGTYVTLQASGGSSYTWDNGVYDGVPFSPTSTTTYTVTSTDVNNNTITDQVTITVNEKITFTTQVTAPSCIEKKDGKIAVTVTSGKPNFSYAWSTGEETNELNNVSIGTYVLKVKDQNNCSQTQSITVSVSNNLSCLFIAEGITPNNDAINDVWVVDGLWAYPKADVKVYNRWGQKVYSANATSSAWDGTFQGEALPTADYYYVIDLGNDTKTITGVVTLKR